VMPSMTYTDSSKDFLLRGEAMKLRHSPSRMGLLSEVFRRGKDMQRSLSPTHPLLAWGPSSEVFVADHDKTDRPFGPDSPFQRLLDLDGKVLCIDAASETITFTHFLEDRIRDRLPFDLYEAEHYPGKVVDAADVVRFIPTLVLSDESRRRRNERVLWKEGVLRHKRVGNSTLSVVGCRELARFVDDADRDGSLIFDVSKNVEHENDPLRQG
jgi:aminoglycoside 3-N-acetyltransferase